MTTWTEEQQKVIDTRQKNMLVSAAAGSGKTAVLVERIVQKILDEEHPVDIDKIVVVTFTKAAAAQMRERVLAAIQNALVREPDNQHLMRQATLVHSAFITTIDSFCNYIVRNYFYEVDLDPAFRIAEEGELKLMRASVMERLMENEYQRAKGETASPFLAFVDTYAQAHSDAAVTEMIFSLYEKSQSYPWPDEWLTQVQSAYAIESVEALQKSAWFSWMVQSVRDAVSEALAQTRCLLHISRTEQGPDCYSAGLERDIEMYEDALAFDDVCRCYQAMREMTFGKIGTKPRNYDKDEALLEKVKVRRGYLKKKIVALQQTFLEKSLEEIVMQIQSQRGHVDELVRLTGEYAKAFAEQKAKRNVLDFGDVEHFAIRILKDEKTHELRPTALALQQLFDEIMIDEYQDSNWLQEEILTSISKESAGGHNMFMVGDVKQSIYAFRQACPQIFMEKYHRFSADGAADIAIDLQRNFRSREEVLDFTNDVFYELMHSDLGDVEYDAAASLNYGAIDYEAKDGMFDGEIIIADRVEDELEEADIDDRISYEAKVIADRIHQLMKTQQVTDRETKQLRPMRFSDVVILLRSPGSMAEQMVDVLMENGIPAYAESRRGYFSTTEVECVLNLLQVMDNPHQDIPLAAVLHSPMFGFTNDELAQIKADQKDGSLMDALMAFAKTHGENEKTADFLHFLEGKRAVAFDMPIHEFIELLLKDTDYLSYVTALPRGENRRANLHQLIDKAVEYEATSYKGLFHFVNYIQQLKQYEVEMGEATLLSENDDAVSILSIHKSKGLEFPVVIVAGLGKEFNLKDTSGKMVLHADLGVGLDFILPDEQTRETPVYKHVVAKAMRQDLYGEEMRVLYVAMTRAKEKLILVAAIKKAEEMLATWDDPSEEMTLSVREDAKQFIEWIVRSTAKKRDRYPITVVTPKDIVVREVEEQMIRLENRDRLLTWLQDAPSEICPDLEGQLEYQYPYQVAQPYKNKYSVSEIKHRRMAEAFDGEVTPRPAFLEQERESVIPAFIAKTQTNGENVGALRGTAMHRFLECFDFARDGGADTLQTQMEEMLQSGYMSAENHALLSVEKLDAFLHSPLANRMMTAAKKEELYKEKPFVMSVAAQELFADAQEQDSILIQGIIDAFFVEDDGIVLLDYKTDRVGDARELIGRYEAQLKLYARALERTMGIPVKECLLYSFCFDEIISIN